MIGFVQADAVRLPLADDSVDLVIGSPPYMDARTYGIGAQRVVEDWIDFMLRCTAEAVRVSRGLVLWVVGGVTRKHCYWPGCEGLLYEWWKRGGRCWRPCFWHRVGIPGSGGKQWFRADIEYVLCFTKCEKYIPWADNTANGHAPKWAPGGEMSYRNSEGTRRNQWGSKIDGQAERNVEGELVKRKRPSSVCVTGLANRDKWGGTDGASSGEGRAKSRRQMARESGIKMKHVSTGSDADGEPITAETYLPPVLANPGNLIQGIKVGGGLMGHHLAHENEAPYPLKLAEWFIASHCPPEGIVLDPFSGSGTTVAAAIALGRQGLGFDLRLNQRELGRRRCAEIQKVLF